MFLNINDVAKLVGMNSRAIRFYESKGLFGVTRSSNSYRVYDEQTVEMLKKIKILRYVGVKISDIRLWQSGILTAKEMLENRYKDLKTEEQLNAEQILVCTKLLQDPSDVLIINDIPDFQESDIIEKKINDTPVHIGLDIGTTTISLIVLEQDLKTICECYSISHYSLISNNEPFHKIQSVDKLINKVNNLIEMAVKYHKNVISIGLTGQMHGIVYIDKNGKAVSDLYTWQDKCGEQPYENTTYCSYLENITGEKTATGYGLVTHFYLMKNNELPQNACKFCTIADYVGMVLTKRDSPIVHLSNAASFGFFSCSKNEFEYEKIIKSEIDIEFLPKITNENRIIGKYKNIPVSVAIGDNQASFAGSVDFPEKTVLVNIGTGSQISILSKDDKANGSFELRPYIGGLRLKCYSAICGGFSYAILENFIRHIVYSATGENKEQYELMEKIASGKENASGIIVNTTFNGTRQSPDVTGSIINITGENFTPENLIYGFSEGIINELYFEYKKTIESQNIEHVVISGNGARKNKLIPQIVKKVFNKQVVIKESAEEAATGAAIFAGKALRGE